MSIASQLNTLEARREAQTQLLQSRFATFTESLNHAPADFIRQHPYASTGTAAALAFLLAQTPLPSRRRRQDHQPPPPPRPARSRSSLANTLLPLLLGTIQSRLFPASHPHLTPANAGTLQSQDFPNNFPSPP